MTTIILTIIGILLAAAAALMVIFYGGDAFNSGSVGAQANTYQNAGTNVISAYQLANADAVVFDLGDERYLKEAPSLPDTAVGTIAVVNTDEAVYQVTGLPENVCERVNTNLKLGAAPVVGATKMGCATGGTFFASLGDSDTVTATVTP